MSKSMRNNDNYIRQARLAEKAADRETSDADRAAWLLIARGWREMPRPPKRRRLATAPRKPRASRAPGNRVRTGAGKPRRSE